MNKPQMPAEKTERDTERRDSVIDRRTGLDRRDIPAEWRKTDGQVGPQHGASAGTTDPSAPAFPVAGVDTNLERRRGPGRRRTDFMKSAEEGEMTQEQFLFVLAIDAFKRVNNKTFPTWTDVLEVIRKLGYRKTMPSELHLGPKAVDWTECPDSLSGVFKEADEDL